MACVSVTACALCLVDVLVQRGVAFGRGVAWRGVVVASLVAWRRVA
ncbi:hypothetical protein ACXZ9C_11500 [Streptococcus agalactiae]